MKKILIFISLATIGNSLKAQIRVGQAINDIPVKTILNSSVKQTSLGKLKGKVILLEFWATYCGPCLDAMPHLQELQEAFKGKLQVITVSTETEKRINKFIINRPSDLWFAVDTADSFRAEFPYHIIPQSVLIDQYGVVAAITMPENITKQTIADLIAGKKISLPLKEDDMVKDPWVAYFSVDPSTQSRFVVQPKVEGQVSGCRRYMKDSIFKDRRISMLNIPLETAFRLAYNDLPYGRTVNLIPKANVADIEKMYCIDLIVPKGRENDLVPILRKELKTRFDLQASVEKRKKTVFVLTVADSTKIAYLKKSTGTKESFSASQGVFQGENIGLVKIADYLEGFGLVALPVVDETNNHTKYDIDFTFMPEKKGDLESVLLSLGLQLKKADRNIDMLIFK